jgi:hypothetical protein
MPTVYKILGQANPNANALTEIYDVPEGNSAVVSTVSFCNANLTSNAFVTMYAVKSGQQPGANNIITNRAILPMTDTLIFTIGMTLASNDRIVANVTTGNIGASVFGSESY